ncbi:putative ABC transporter permease [Syntrophomonas wolfei]|uniref:putative ABC transporter permease n=1 Tax=Syntrophomonas wolfei TaxID=863 RepID=UPI0002EA032D|nr:putative ABC transporter permease [Syntrophomonas wolfei]
MEKIICLFFIYAFLGWCTEVIYAGVNRGVFVNRGFLNGPICPIYGFGVLTVLICLLPLHENLLLLYVGSVVLTSLLELLSGFLMEKFFHQRWWDYSDEPFNIGGYICLKFSLLWGFACVLIVEVVHPLINQVLASVPDRLSLPFLLVFSSVFVIDNVVTVVTVAKLNQRLQQLDEVARALRRVSDAFGSVAADGSIALSDANEKLREDLRAKHEELIALIHMEQKRLLNAFPNIQSRKHREVMEEIKAHVRKKLEKKYVQYRSRRF